MTTLDPDLQLDIDAIGEIDAVRTILDVVCKTTGMGFAAVARVTEDRWIACEVLDNIGFGLKPGGELEIKTTICNEIRQHRDAVIIDDVKADGVYHSHHTPALYGLQSYISMPILRRDGSFFGTLCAIDPRPARLKNPETIGMFRLFAELIAFHLDARTQLANSATSLREERGIAELRDQFIAVLGHDLRNPLASIDAGARMLTKTPLNEKAAGIVTLIQGSVSRMEALISDVLDFARGRMGGGLSLNREKHGALAHALDQVVAEYRSTHPDREIETNFAFDRAVDADAGRISQLASNLVGNALAHGADTGPVRVVATAGADGFELAVSNPGPPIPEAAQKNLFKPFHRGHGASNRGLGLGLYIASEIARAHRGTLTVTSSPEHTTFTFRMPLD